MKDFLLNFIKEDGRRLFYMLLASIFGLSFWYLGLEGEGKTILVGVAMYCFKRAQGTALGGNEGNNVK